MKDDRVITLPVFKTMVTPVALKAWKCDLCKEPVEVGERYTHYVNRKPHEIIHYRFHTECFHMVMAYCEANKKANFTPRTVANWVRRKFCEGCNGTDCTIHECKKIRSWLKIFRKSP